MSKRGSHASRITDPAVEDGIIDDERIVVAGAVGGTTGEIQASVLASRDHKVVNPEEPIPPSDQQVIDSVTNKSKGANTGTTKKIVNIAPNSGNTCLPPLPLANANSEFVRRNPFRRARENLYDRCQVCGILISVNLLQCNGCNANYHLQCVEMSSGPEGLTWWCTNCRSEVIARENPRQQQPAPTKTFSGTVVSAMRHRSFYNPPPPMQHGTQDEIQEPPPPRAGSRASASSRGASRRIELQLKKLEEEKRFHQQYLDQKYSLMLELESESSSLSLEDEMEKVANWINATDGCGEEPDSGVDAEVTEEDCMRNRATPVMKHVAHRSGQQSMQQSNVNELPLSPADIFGNQGQPRQAASLINPPGQLSAAIGQPGNASAFREHTAQRVGLRNTQQPYNNALHIPLDEDIGILSSTRQVASHISHPGRLTAATRQPRQNLGLAGAVQFTEHAAHLIGQRNMQQSYVHTRQISPNEGIEHDYGQPRPNMGATYTTNNFIPRQGSTPMRRSLPIQDPPNLARQLPDPIGNEAVCILTRNQLAARQAVSRDLPDFSGNSEDWPLFFSVFNTSTQMCGFSPEENMLRLRKCLKDKALEAVRCRLLHPSNVDGVINTLKMLYGRPEAIIQSIIKKIKGLPSPNMERLDTVVNFALAVENLVATMQACQIGDFVYNASLRLELVDRLPPALKLDWAKCIRNSPAPNLIDFSSWLYSTAEDASAVMVLPSSGLKFRGMKKEGFLNHHSESDTEPSRQNSTKTASGMPQKDQAARTCVACRGTCWSLIKCKRFNEFSFDSKWATIKEHKFCRKCLGKHNGSCKLNKPCGVNGCIFLHHPLLHGARHVSGEANTAQQNSSQTETASINIHQGQSEFLFRIFPVTLYGPRKTIRTYAFVDDGSELSLLEQSLADELGVKGTTIPLCLKWTGDTCRTEEASQQIGLQISAAQNPDKKYTLSDVRTVEKLKIRPQTLQISVLQKQYPHLTGLPLESYQNISPGLLIGLDNAALGHVINSREGKLTEPIAVKTRLGWTVYGCCSNNKRTAHYVNFHSVEACPCRTNDEDLHSAMKNYFALDSLGVTAPTKQLLSSEDQRAQMLLETLTTPKDGRYECGLLWKYENVRLPDSKVMALNRWKCLDRRLTKNPSLAKVLRLKIDDYVAKNYVRRLSAEELDIPRSRVWYLPMFPVWNPNKPGKTRLVWDAAAMSHGISLNSMLLKGPDQLTSLLAVLIKFREFKIAICADIREMYHQVQMRENDQHCQRFFWKHKETDSEPSVYIMKVQSFGACCSPGIAQHVKNKNAERFEHQYPAAVQAITDCHYVDDMLMSVETEEEAVQVSKEVREIHNSGGFEMHNWLSNSTQVLQALQESTAKEKDFSSSSETMTEKVLGMWWNTNSDCFTYKLSSRHESELLSGERRPTKREVLRMLMMLFDPLGLIAHFTMLLKILLQEIWRSSVGWDDAIEDVQFAKWLEWLKALPRIPDIRIPRCYRTSTSLADGVDIQLHIFMDASENGFAAAVYLRFQERQTIECTLVAAKTRVAPLKFLSIPRSELQACVIGVRLSETVLQSLSIKITRRFFWTDSRDVLCWLNSDHRRYSQFVAHRISEILETSNVDEWHWIPTKHNVADDGIKWKPTINLCSSSRCQVNKTPLTVGPLIQSEFSRAERYLYRLAQENVYCEEITALSSQNSSELKKEVAKSSSIRRLSPFLDEYGILRVRGRTSACKFADYDTVNPIILPPKGYITKLIVADFHRKFLHQNHATTMNEIRQRFHIIRLKGMYRTVRLECQQCRNDYAVPLPPAMGDLPQSRLAAFTLPFVYMGVDYFGPLFVVVGRRTEKRWGVLGTCLTTRAICIEIAHTLNTDSCVMALRNIMVRRGVPAVIYSDRGTNFQGASKEMHQEMHNLQERLKAQFTTSKTEWVFIPPVSPHMGGAWERMIRTVKQNLNKLQPNRFSSDEVLRNTMMEVENIVNSRPLTEIPLDDDQSPVLTPNHFLMGAQNGLKSRIPFDDSPSALKHGWQHSQVMANKYWKLWLRDYLPTITRRSKWHSNVKPIEVDDLVIVVDPKLPRNQWPRGRVIGVTTSKDGQVRSATVRTPNGGIYERPTVKLAVLDVGVSRNTSSENPSCIQRGNVSSAQSISEPLVHQYTPVPQSEDRHKQR